MCQSQATGQLSTSLTGATDVVLLPGLPHRVAVPAYQGHDHQGDQRGDHDTGSNDRNHPHGERGVHRVCRVGGESAKAGVIQWNPS